MDRLEYGGIYLLVGSSNHNERFSMTTEVHKGIRVYDRNSDSCQLEGCYTNHKIPESEKLE